MLILMLAAGCAGEPEASPAPAAPPPDAAPAEPTPDAPERASWADAQVGDRLTFQFEGSSRPETDGATWAGAFPAWLQIAAIEPGAEPGDPSQIWLQFGAGEELAEGAFPRTRWIPLQAPADVAASEPAGEPTEPLELAGRTWDVSYRESARRDGHGPRSERWSAVPEGSLYLSGGAVRYAHAHSTMAGGREEVSLALTSLESGPPSPAPPAALGGWVLRERGDALSLERYALDPDGQTLRGESRPASRHGSIPDWPCEPGIGGEGWLCVTDAGPAKLDAPATRTDCLGDEGGWLCPALPTLAGASGPDCLELPAWYCLEDEAVAVYASDPGGSCIERVERRCLGAAPGAEWSADALQPLLALCAERLLDDPPATPAAPEDPGLIADESRRRCAADLELAHAHLDAGDAASLAARMVEMQRADCAPFIGPMQLQPLRARARELAASGQRALDQDLLVDARRDLTLARAVAPDLPGIDAALGRCAVRAEIAGIDALRDAADAISRGDPDGAIAHYRSALAVTEDPADPIAIFAQARIDALLQ